MSHSSFKLLSEILIKISQIAQTWPNGLIYQTKSDRHAPRGQNTLLNFMSLRGTQNEKTRTRKIKGETYLKMFYTTQVFQI